MVEWSISPWTDLLPFCVVTHHMEKKNLVGMVKAEKKKKWVFSPLLYCPLLDKCDMILYCILLPTNLSDTTHISSRWVLPLISFLTACFSLQSASSAHTRVHAEESNFVFCLTGTCQRYRVVPGQKRCSVGAKMETLSSPSYRTTLRRLGQGGEDDQSRLKLRSSFRDVRSQPAF